MQKSIGEKVLGWFIVEENDESPKEEDFTEVKEKAVRSSADALHSNAPNPSPRATAAPSPNGSVAPRATALGTVPSLADDDRERLGRVLTLLDRLPPEATPEMKRALVAASLDAFGVRVDAIIGSSQRAIAALDAFTEATRAKTANTIAEADARIARLNQEILEIRRSADAQRAANEETLRQAAGERSRLQGALAFLHRP